MNVEDQYMDDLFGEADNVSHHIATAAPVAKGLAERLDALASSNCCSKIAWSRFGCIASVSHNGKRLDLRLLIRSPKTGEWRLQKPTAIWPPLPEDHKIVHLSFSAMGNDLAVMDSAGRILLYTTGFMLTSMMLVHTAVAESFDEMNEVVGVHWLPVFPHTQKSAVFWSASRNNDAWNVRSQQHQAPGPYNPLDGKSALVCLTRKGTIRLLWQTRKAWSETTIDLQDAGSAVEFSFTHGAFAPTKDALLLTAHQVRRSLRIYQIRINWNLPPKPENEQQAQAQAQTANPNPTLEVRSLIEEDSFSPLSLPTEDQDHTSTTTTSVTHPEYAFNLSKLLFVPPAPEQGMKDATVHTVLGIFAVIPPRQEGMILEAAQQWGQASSVLARWEIQGGLADKLSPCFDQLSVKKKGTNGVTPRQRARLKRLEDIPITPAVLSMRPVRNNTMYALTLSDGTVQFRYRGSVDVVLPDEHPDEVASLVQSGFTFPAIEPCLHTALSPGACVVATLQPEDDVKLEKMQYLNGSIAEIGENDSKHDALAALFALQYSSACTQYKVTDDLLAILPTNLSTSLTRTTILLCIRFLNVDFDLLSCDLQKIIFPLFRNHLPARCFSLQNALGAADKEGSRKVAARLAWITLNLRHVSQNVFLNLSRADQALKPEMAISIVGLIKWSLDLLVYILQELLSLHYALLHAKHDTGTDHSTDLTWIQSHIRSNHSPALLLLLSSLPRIFLRVLFRPLRYAYAHSSKGFANTVLGNEQRGAFHKLLGVYNTTPVNHTSLGPLEEFVVEIENLVRSAYDSARIQPGPQRQAVEREMFVHGTVPTALLPAATAILTTKLDALMDRIDAGKVHVHDVSWLGLTDDARTRHFYDGHVIDVVRKMPLAPNGGGGAGAGGTGTKVRVCPRCGSVMEDIGGQGPGMAQQQAWVWQSHKVCVCFSSWASPEEGDGDGVGK